ncbi:putative 2-acylglycerol O-acyltransferase 1 isoform 2 [Apostichopus japonicus]|uniref:Acyltransferase n=1 Tax=Stichopus japonicus TaxID=307972 RepID=A0A2G8KAJ4_STIJA|nr:putative 2-acylglycerol O-acyltransferase 1 isoform 2 [Apostichopus japonicus]
MLFSLAVAEFTLILAGNLHDETKMSRTDGGDIFNIKFAPLNIPRKRLCKLWSYTFWFIFLLSAIICILICLALLLTGHYFIFLALVTWTYIDRATPISGGRRSAWVRNWALFKNMVDYFPYKLIKTVDIDPKHCYIFGFHPHGIMGMGLFAHFASEGSNFSQIFPGITPYPLTLHGWFYIPIIRDYLMLSGLCSVQKESMDWILSRPGNVAIVAVGGARESLDAKPGENKVILNPRKGFIKRAIINGAHLVPMYSFGEIEMYDQIDNTKYRWLRKLQEKLTKIVGVAPPLFHGRGLFNYNFGLMPHRVPINTVVGKPIPVEKSSNPSKEEIVNLHQQYVQALIQLFEDNKSKYGLKKEDKLQIL